MRKPSLSVLASFCMLLSAGTAFCGTPVKATPHDVSPCPRFAAGSTVVAPEDLYSSAGILQVHLTYETRVDSFGNTLYCFMSSDGSQSPTMHVHPGDELVIDLVDGLPFAPPMAGMAMPAKANAALPMLKVDGLPSPSCGAMVMTASSVNMHFHGTNVSPTCHQDEVIKTMINSGEALEYDIHFPLNEPPGLYWYHPHIHGIAEAAVQGGASGAIVVEGIQNVTPGLTGLPQRILIVRDNNVPANAMTDSPTLPAWDLSLNYVPVPFPKYAPAIIPMKASQKELWRVLNASADTILDVQVQYNYVPQPLQVVAIDGVATGSQDGTAGGHSITVQHFLIPPAGRVEFVVAPPGKNVKLAQLLTLNVDTGPFGDYDPQRPLANITTTPSTGPSKSLTAMSVVPEATAPPVSRPRFANLQSAVPTAQRSLYFSEVLSDPTDPNSPTNFYITVAGATPTLFSPENPPAIVTTRGAVEDWTIQNQALENHEFHIHQIHFLVLEDSNDPTLVGQYLDTINVPYYSGTGPFPSVKLRMDFRGEVVGDFVYHCHILGHEDSGMMSIIRVLPQY